MLTLVRYTQGHSLFVFLLLLAVSGLIIGALARLVIPGRQPMGLLATIAVGIAGSLLGGLVGRALFGPSYAPGLIISVVFAALLVLLISRSRRR